MSSHNSNQTQEFFRKWEIEFYAVLLTTIKETFGYEKSSYSNGHYFVYLKPPNQKIRRKLATAKLKNFHDFVINFRHLCKQNGINLYYLGQKKPYNPIPLMPLARTHRIEDDLTKECSKLNMYLEKHFYLLRDSYKQTIVKHKNRPRIPVSIAFEIARAIHFCRGDRQSLHDLHKLLKPGGKINRLILESIESERKSIINYLDEEINYDRQKLREKASPRAKAERKREILLTEASRQRVCNQKIHWKFISSKDNSNTQWANHLKEHLIRVILSEDKPTMIKSFKGLKKQKEKMTKEFEVKNNNTLKS